jgi:hypothetical protein
MTTATPMRDARAQARELLTRYRDNPVRFAREVLGVRVWKRQADVLNAVVKHARVSVRSGHKTGKSTSAAILALWWVCTRRRGRVIMTSATYRQIKSILWKELRRILRGAPFPVGGVLADDPETGLQFEDGREILGFSAKDPEKVAGFSGPEMLFIMDEASGIPEPIFEAVEGNRAAGARVAMFSNPTQTSGTFYDSHNGSREFWYPIHISSRESPNVVEGRVIIPGLAGREWVEEKLAEWGQDSAMFQVRVEGNFPKQGSNAIIALGLVEAALARFAELPDDDGPLEIGLDVAEFGDDDSVLIARRGRKVYDPECWHGLDAVQLAGKVLAYVREYRALDGEIATVKVDVVGVGAGVASILGQHAKEIRVVRVNASATPTVDEHAVGKLKNMRAQLWVGLRDWLKTGGMPSDGRLEAELVAPLYFFDVGGRLQVEAKAEIRKRLGRSTDRADALALAVLPADVAGSWFI